MLPRNIYLAYLLTISRFSWFWFGIWVLFYLRFTNYAGIGLIETVLIVTMTTMEIPTGAIADLWGKKKTLMVGFLLETIGAIMYATALNLPDILVSVFIMCVGGTLISGTLEALVYDSLKEDKNEKKFDKVVANINSLQLITPALLGIIGGYLYSYHYRLPFIANAVCYGIGFVLTFWLIEPKLDTEKISWQNYWHQTKQGFHQLFKTSDLINQTLLLLSISVIIVITEEMLNGFLGTEFGFTDIQMGFLFAVVYLISAGASQLTPWLTSHVSLRKAVLMTGFILAVSLVLPPLVNLWLGGVLLVCIASATAIIGNLNSISINQSTESKHRATTISTFNMIKNIPYVLTAYLFGSLADLYSAKNIAMILGFSLVGLLVIQSLNQKKRI